VREVNPCDCGLPLNIEMTSSRTARNTGEQRVTADRNGTSAYCSNGNLTRGGRCSARNKRTDEGSRKKEKERSAKISLFHNYRHASIL